MFANPQRNDAQTADAPRGGFRIAVFVSGGGSNLQALLDAQERGEFASRIVAVLSNKPDAYALERARRCGIDTLVIDPDAPAAEVCADRATVGASADGVTVAGAQASRASGWLDWLLERRVDLILLAGYLRKIPEDVVARFRGRIYNIHPALLPKYGGAGFYGLRVHRAVLAAGDAVSGPTVHAVTDEYDEGAILLQEQVDISDCATAEEIAVRVLAAEHRIYPQAVRLLERQEEYHG